MYQLPKYSDKPWLSGKNAESMMAISLWAHQAGFSAPNMTRGGVIGSIMPGLVRPKSQFDKTSA